MKYTVPINVELVLEADNVADAEAKATALCWDLLPGVDTTAIMDIGAWENPDAAADGFLYPCDEFTEW